jgi:hypothetical protein
MVDVVLLEGPALAGDEGPELPTVPRGGLLEKGAPDNVESAGGLAVVMPSVECPCRPGKEPDVDMRVGVQLDPR